MVQSLGGIALAIGAIGILSSFVFMAGLDYPSPPFPAGYMVGMACIALGGGVTIGSSALAVRQQKGTQLPQWIVIAVLGAGLAAYGITEIVKHPLELPDCPCPTNYYGAYPCIPCPQNFAGVCNGRGVCDDGNIGTGDCYCDVGWDGENCDECAPTFQGGQCNECTRGWDGPTCDQCYPGYSGPDCDQCAEGWIPETDSLGTLCRTCETGRYGGYCTVCQDCQKHDPNGQCKDNQWHLENIYNAALCTPDGSTCSNKYGCDSFNCKGLCVIGDETTGQVCEFSGECFPGECQFKQCCLEARHGNGHCECGSIGYLGEDCQACPGFDGVYSNTICTGHGTCAAQYAGNTYIGLACECTPDGVMPFPAWTGHTCSCLKNTATDNDCSKCATGSFGTQCTSCPGGSGISQCNMHGRCDDGTQGQGTCTCDIDVKYGGLGAFKGEACEACLSGDFYGGSCKTCPNLQVVQCIPGLNLTEIPGVGSCIQSCGDKTCNNNTGFCQ
jgi:hypothetical protein